MSELKIQDLSVAHLAPVNLSVNAGELVCLSGESGSGKSLLLRAVADLIPHDGEVYLNDEACASMPAPLWRQRVTLLPAEAQWWQDEVAAHFTRQDPALLQALGLREEAMQWQVARCSTGERQRLALLRVLINRPACLLLDEPTGSLDPRNTQRVEELVQRLCQEWQIPVLWVSHSQEQIQRLAGRHFVMHEGRLAAYAN